MPFCQAKHENIFSGFEDSRSRRGRIVWTLESSHHISDRCHRWTFAIRQQESPLCLCHTHALGTTRCLVYQLCSLFLYHNLKVADRRRFWTGREIIWRWIDYLLHSTSHPLLCFNFLRNICNKLFWIIFLKISSKIVLKFFLKNSSKKNFKFERKKILKNNFEKN